MALTQRAKRASAGEIGEIPRIVNPARRETCRLDLHAYLVTYFPHSTGISPFGKDQRNMIDRLQRCILGGGRFVNAMPRGFAKSSIAENAILWATTYAHRQFTPIFSADSMAAIRINDSLKRELDSNELLAEDFPEICFPVRAIEGRTQRCRSQTYLGDPTFIDMGAGELVLPTLKLPEDWTAIGGPTSTNLVPNKSGGAIVLSYGITAASRGMKYKRPDGSNARPDFIMIDDPQTDESAGTDLQVGKRMDIIRRGILKTAGHFKRLAVIINGTVIAANDMIDQLLDPVRNPAWQGERVAMVKAWGPAHDTLWLRDYMRLRTTYDAAIMGDQTRAHGEATEFYRANRLVMDAGVEVSWSECYDHGTELSAVQHAYNLLIDDGADVFASECQNRPVAKIEGETDFRPIRREEMLKRLNNLPVGVVPLACNRISAFIDVQHTALYYVVGAFAEDFTGSIISYGCYPDPGRPIYNLRDLQRTLQDEAGTTTIEAAVKAGLKTLTDALMAREWRREDGVAMRVERCLIDSGDLTDTINEFCRTCAFAGSVMASRGYGITAGKTPMEDKKIDQTWRRGHGWIIRPTANKAQRYVQIDVNEWKTFFHQRLHVKVGDPSALTLYGREHEHDHRQIAAHWSSEYCNKTEGLGRTVYEWALRPNDENHLLDCTVGCLVAASILGCTLGGKKPERSKPRYVSMSKILGQS